MTAMDFGIITSKEILTNIDLGTFGFGGVVAIRNIKGDVDQPDMLFSSISATGDGFFFGSIEFEARNAAIVSTNGINAFTVGDINVNASGIGEVRSDFDIDLRARGRFTATHDNRPADGATVRGEYVTIRSDSEFDARGGTKLLARDELYVQSFFDPSAACLGRTDQAESVISRNESVS